VRAVLPVAAAALLLAGCAPAAPAAPGDPDALTGSVTVLAAASLTGSLDDLAGRFEDTHPGVDVVIGYGGSAALAEQILSGVPADVFFAADEATMLKVVEAGLAADPHVLLANVLEIAAPAGNPGGVTGLADLADPDLVVALCDPAAPCGRAAARLFELAGIEPAADTLEENVRAALAKVALGEVDAALVYATDVIAAGDAVAGIPVPEAVRALNRYPLAVLADAPHPVAARAFADFLRSDAARDVFLGAGFRAP